MTYWSWKSRTGGPKSLGQEMCEKGSPPLRLKEWLILQINSGKYPGLRWEDEEKTMFRIPWKHASKQNYSKQEDAALFKAWTMYKGKFREGSIKEDASVWKTRLRCALNKSPDFEEIMENCEDQGEPYKRYRIVSEPRERTDEGNREASKNPQTEGASRPTEEPQTVLMENTKIEGLPDIQNQLLGSRSPMEIGCLTEPVTWRNHQIHPKVTDLAEEAAVIPPSPSSSSSSSSSSSDFWLHVRLYYQDNLVTEVTTKTAEGCHIVPLSSSQSEYSLGPPIPLEIIALPSPEDLPGFLSPDMHIVLKKLLMHLDKGVLLWVAPEGVFVKRQCQVRVYWSGPLAVHTDQPNKLERHKTCKVLDTELFMNELEMYVMRSGPEPNYQIQLCFGEEFPDSTMNAKKLITAHVEPVFARERLVKVNSLQKR
ncbi:interferon regulatory factor 4-like [Pseudophryne corroboree]|uniref:interferon regulatory factor 4-like n=1 Tax=Pseudophryne corroboree TaxID=495146 RepID=UPI003081E2D9